jgi:hypothetical protein
MFLSGCKHITGKSTFVSEIVDWKRVVALEIPYLVRFVNEIQMSCVLYVTNLPADVTLEALIIYFQSSTKSGGGDVDADACKLEDNGRAIVVFEKKECKYSSFKSESHPFEDRAVRT